MAKRILALVAAVAMVAGALAYRSSHQPGRAGARAGAVASEVICAAELGAVCDAVAGARIEPAGESADRLIAAPSVADAGVAGWLVAGPWPEMVDDARARASRPKLFAASSQGIGSAPLVAVARKGQLPSGCGADVTWKCLGDAAQQASFRIGGDPVSSSDGLFLRAAALGGYFGRSDFATNDLDDQPDARTWLENLNLRLASAIGFGARSLESFVLQQGSASVYLTGGAAARSLNGNAAFEVRTPTPAVVIAVGYRASSRGRAEIDLKAVSAALEAQGWTVQPTAKTEGLPSPGVLLALRSS